jgi:hypothetical protein
MQFNSYRRTYVCICLMMASWKPKHVVMHYLKLQTYFINCCVVAVYNKEISIFNTTGCIHWKLKMTINLCDHNMLRISWVSEQILASQGLNSMHTISLLSIIRKSCYLVIHNVIAWITELYMEWKFVWNLITTNHPVIIITLQLSDICNGVVSSRLEP